MELVYLSNGQACYLKETIGSRFIVNKVFEWDDEDGTQESIDSDDIVVDAVFKNPPTEKLDNKIKELIKAKDCLVEEISNLYKERTTIESELNKLKRMQVDKEKFIIDRSELINAKTLVLFKQRNIMPTILTSEKNIRGIKLSLNIELIKGEERRWGYELYYDDWSTGDYLCEKYGFLINPTQEQIDEVIIKRLAEIEFSDSALSYVDDKYLSPNLLIRKNNYLKAKQENDKERLEKEIRITQEKLDNLNASLLKSNH